MKNEILSRVVDHLKNRFPGEPATVQDLATLATAIVEEIAAIPRPAESIRRYVVDGNTITDESGGIVGRAEFSEIVSTKIL